MSEQLFVEKYRPRTIAETILPDHLKKTFSEFVEKKNIPNLLLSGSAGVGKTTVAKAMLEECGYDYMMINGSMNGNIDTLRTDIKNYASSVSLTGVRKFVILDEADYLNPQSTQPALRNFMEEYSKNCGFILTCNFRNRIVDPLQSRCSVVEFKAANKDKQEMAKQFFVRLQFILDAEGIEYDKKVLVELIKAHFPDFRRTLNEVQRYSSSGKIDAGILVNMSDESFKVLMGYLKEKNFNAMRKWVAQNTDIDSNVLYRRIYDAGHDYFKESSLPMAIIHCTDYAYKSAFVADPEMSLAACLTEIMSDCEFK